MKQRTAFKIGYPFVALMSVVLARDLWVGASPVQAIPYSEFQHHLRSGELESIQISEDVIQTDLKKTTADGRARILTTRVDPALAEDLLQT